jgi:hypothetical protein
MRKVGLEKRSCARTHGTNHIAHPLEYRLGLLVVHGVTFLFFGTPGRRAQAWVIPNTLRAGHTTIVVG